MSLKNLEAALLQLKGKATEHFGAIEILLNNPAGISEHTNYVSEIIRHAKGLAECEGAYGSLQTHFVPKVAPPAPPPAPRPAEPETSVPVTEENSPTMKRALKRTTSRKKREAKKDEK